MTVHGFGGVWTAEKLDALRRYLDFYATALHHQPSRKRPFRLVYIDAFAGTGRCRIARSGDGAQVIDGSARIALDTVPGFDRYVFIEYKAKHRLELQQLIDDHVNGARAEMNSQAAEDALPRVLASTDWSSHRGVLFLDPYGLQCDYALLQQIAKTKALDVLFLLSLSGLFRQAAIEEQRIDEAKAAKLTRILGTDDWRTHLYKREQFDMFDAPLRTRDRGWTDVLDFATQRLQALFPYVADPVLLPRGRGAPRFALYFMVSNPTTKAQQLARRVSADILKPLR